MPVPELRWSPNRVGESVMNSRSAKNDTPPNRVSATSGPLSQPIQNTNTMNQLVRMMPSRFFSSAALAVAGFIVPVLPQRHQKRHDAGEQQQAKHNNEQVHPLAGSGLDFSGSGTWTCLTRPAGPLRRCAPGPETHGALRLHPLAWGRRRSQNTAPVPAPLRPWGVRAAHC